MKGAVLGLSLFFVFSATVTCLAQLPLDEDHVAISEKVIRVGQDIAYYDESGVLKISDPTFIKDGENYSCETTKLKVYIDGSPQDSLWPLRVKYQNKSLGLRLDSFGYYNSQSDSFRPIGLPSYSEIGDQTKPYYVLFRNVLPGINLSFALSCEGISVITRFANRDGLDSSLPGEDHFGIALETDLSCLPDYQLLILRGGGKKDYYIGSNNVDESNPSYGLYQTLMTGDYTGSRRVLLSVPDANASYEKALFKICDDKLYNPAIIEDHENHAHPVKVIKRMGDKDYLLSLIPLAYVDNLTDSGFPVLMFFSISGSTRKNPDEAFLPTYTYIIEGKYKVASLKSQGTSENPVYVRFLRCFDGRINVTKTGGAGVKIDNTIFTSIFDTDTSHGPEIDLSLLGLQARDPVAGDYATAIDAVKGTGSYIRNGQFYYAKNAITNFSSNAADNTQEITNCLIDKCSGTGIILKHWGNFLNNTVRRCNKGVEVEFPSDGSVNNCVFAENQNAGVNELPPDASGNVWFANNPHAEAGTLGTGSVSEINGLTNPFTECPEGDSCLRNDLQNNNGDPIDFSGTGFKYEESN